MWSSCDLMAALCAKQTFAERREEGGKNEQRNLRPFVSQSSNVTVL